MINEYYAKKYCKEDISLIENYEQAVNDNNQMWVCHHKEEIKVLPSGMTVIHSYKELKEKGLYYGRPANELIFLTKKEHQRLHFLNYSEETRRKFTEAHKGHTLSAEHRRKIIEANKGRTLSEDTRRKISEALKGLTLSEEHRKKMSEAMKGEHNPFYGKTHNDETRKKISEAMKRRWAAKS